MRLLAILTLAACSRLVRDDVGPPDPADTARAAAEETAGMPQGCGGPVSVVPGVGEAVFEPIVTGDALLFRPWHGWGLFVGGQVEGVFDSAFVEVELRDVDAGGQVGSTGSVVVGQLDAVETEGCVVTFAGLFVPFTWSYDTGATGCALDGRTVEVVVRASDEHTGATGEGVARGTLTVDPSYTHLCY